MTLSVVHAPDQLTKTPRDENFPVASLVLGREQRAAVLTFYRFVRRADDVADAPHLAAEDKLAQLAALRTALIEGNPSVTVARDLHALQARCGTGVVEALALLDAFRQDVAKARYADWAELLGSCRLSANPVGHFLLRLHGEADEAFAPADALCTALQILNHLQDLRKDREALDRIYIPVPWLDRAGGEAAFFDPLNAQRRAVLDAALDRVEALIDTARIVPARVASRRLRAQCAATIVLADRLAARLRKADPILRRVEIGSVDASQALIGSALPCRTDEQVTQRAVRRSGSSFRLGMRSLPAARRRAMHAVYAFCRAVDDIADGAAPAIDKRRFLAAWRDEIDRLDSRPETPIGRELAFATQRFGLPRGEFHQLLDGMETDCDERVRLADDTAFDLYARRVAGAVGVLSIHAFGAPEARDFALGLGRTLQLVNVLRDVEEDAGRERLYVPLSRLGREDASAAAIVADARFARVCQALAAEARAGFAAADAALAGLDPKRLKPAVLMMESYRRLLDRLEARGWRAHGGRLRLTAADRLQLLTLALRAA